ncbi:hypothetical protein Tco_1177699 [Tanacetum coccineum]
MVKVRDKRAAAYRTLDTKEGKEVSRKCLYRGEKTNKQKKATCPFNPKYATKLARIAAAEQGAITAVATEQATRASTTEQATNAS